LIQKMSLCDECSAYLPWYWTHSFSFTWMARVVFRHNSFWKIFFVSQSLQNLQRWWVDHIWRWLWTWMVLVLTSSLSYSATRTQRSFKPLFFSSSLQNWARQRHFMPLKNSPIVTLSVDGWVVA
jgi:hypothetical protein